MNRQFGHRRSIRIADDDYATPGTYFITVCVQHRACVFGNVEGAEMSLGPVGQMVDSWWGSIGGRFPSVSIDAHVVMPNHLHGLLRFGWDIEGPENSFVAEKGRHGGLPLQSPPHESTPIFERTATADRRGKHGGLPFATNPDVQTEPPGSVTLGKVIQWFKTATTTDYKVGIDLLGWPPYPGRLWQRNYSEHIVRDEAALERIRAYVEGNRS